jgi:hypothetical protein
MPAGIVHYRHAIRSNHFGDRAQPGGRKELGVCVSSPVSDTVDN